MAAHPFTTVAVIGAYLSFTVLLSTLSRARSRSANDFLNATRALPTWVSTLSFLASNCTALEVLGLSGLTLKYGVQIFHFYWIGAIPALIFMSFVLLPLYRSVGSRSVPEYLGARFGPSVRLMNAWALLLSTCAYAGINLYALMQIMRIAAGWSLALSAVVFSVVSLSFVLVGGLRTTVYNECLQFIIMLLGIGPLLLFSRRDHIGSPAIIGQRLHAWSSTPFVSSSAPVDLIGVVIGLGLIISFSYWCTDFLLVQRALTARTLESARRVPLFAGFGKLLFGFMVVYPVLALSHPLTVASGHVLDLTVPTLMKLLYRPAFLSVGFAALVAGFVNGLAGNVTAFSSLWTEEIYRVSIHKGRSEAHYIFVGRLASVACVGLGIASATATLHFENLSQFVLLIMSLLGVPFFVAVMLGLLSARFTSRNIIVGTTTGIAAGVALRCISLVCQPFGSALNTNFYTAIVTFAASILGCRLYQARGPIATTGGPSQFVLTRAVLAEARPSVALYILASLLLAMCIALNLIWR